MQVVRLNLIFRDYESLRDVRAMFPHFPLATIRTAEPVGARYVSAISPFFRLRRAFFSGDDVRASVFDQKMHVIRRYHEVQHRQPEAILGLENPAQVTALVALPTQTKVQSLPS
jgi:hypothetical protein